MGSICQLQDQQISKVITDTSVSGVIQYITYPDLFGAVYPIWKNQKLVDEERRKNQ
jgi:hypothetical protein